MTTKATGLLAVWMQIPAELEPELNDWYTKEHLPERIEIPGFQTALRYVSVEGSPKYMAMYDLDSPEVLYSDAYNQLRKNSSDWTRRIGRSLEKNVRHEYELLGEVGSAPSKPAQYVHLVRFGSNGEAVESWMQDEWLPAMAAVPGVIRARGFVAKVGEPKYLAFYELENAGVLKSNEWQAAAAKTGMDAKLTDVSSNLGQFIEAAEFDGRNK